MANPSGKRLAGLCLAPALALAAAVSVGSSASGASPRTECIDRAQSLGDPVLGDGEPSVKVSQRDPRWLVASWTTQKGLGEVLTPIQGNVILAQRDANGRWTQEVVSSPGTGGDSWLDTAPSGAAYASYINAPGSPQVFVRRIVPGQPAGPPLGAPDVMVDHPALAVDQRARKNDRLVLVASNQSPGNAIAAISDDAGHSWRQPVDFPAHLPGFEQLQAAPVVASGGDTVVTAWVELSMRAGDLVAAIRVAPINPSSGAVDAATTVAVMRSSAFLPFGSSTIPSVSVVRGGPHEGRAYVVWPQRRGGPASPLSDILASASDDGGFTWTTPRKVNDDTSPAVNYHVFPSVSASEDGSALVAWMDTRADPNPTKTRALMYGARVGDNGMPGANLRLTSCPTFGVSGNPALGDYFNFDASQGRPVMVFPNIRTEGADSDVFLLE